MRKLSLGFVLLFLFHLGASAPTGAVANKQPAPPSKASKTKTSLSSVSTPQALGDQLVQLFRHKTGKELMAEKTGAVPRAAGSSAKTVKTSSLKPGYVPPPPTPPASLPQIRQEIQKIFDLNKKIKNVQSGRSVQLQRVQEQARIHQKILDELEASQKQGVGQKASAKNALLAQEKLRIIHEETQRNTQMMEALKDVPAELAPQAAKKVKSTAS